MAGHKLLELKDSPEALAMLNPNAAPAPPPTPPPAPDAAAAGASSSAAESGGADGGSGADGGGNGGGGSDGGGGAAGGGGGGGGASSSGGEGEGEVPKGPVEQAELGGVLNAMPSLGFLHSLQRQMPSLTAALDGVVLDEPAAPDAADAE
jgi:hypothetical protein